MPADTINWIIAVIAMFGVFMVGVGYVSVVAAARAITHEEEQVTRQLKAKAKAPVYSEPLKQAA